MLRLKVDAVVMLLEVIKLVRCHVDDCLNVEHLELLVVLRKHVRQVTNVHGVFSHLTREATQAERSLQLGLERSWHA